MNDAAEARDEVDVPPQVSFTGRLLASGKTATGFAVHDDVVVRLGHGKRPPVRVTIGGHSYRSTMAVMGGRFMLGVSAENRRAAGVAAGDEVEVRLELDTQPRSIDVPADLTHALDADAAARRAFDGLSTSRKRWHVLAVEGAKTAATRQRRIDASMALLRDASAE